MISVESMSFTYPKQPAPTVKELDFEVRDGEIFGFLGPSGAGKSTTQKLMIGLLRDYRGSVRILGREARDWGAEYYYRIGVGFEMPNHFNKLTGLENLRFFLSLYDNPSNQGSTADPMALLDQVGLAEDADKRVGEFSKGMKMRLNFVRAIMHDPDLLFLDEPTAGLDPVNARTIKDIILDLKSRGKTIFLTTHNMHDADELCDRVAFIVDGQLKLIDAPGALKLEYGNKTVHVDYLEGGEVKSEQFDLETLGHNQRFLDILRSGNLSTIHSQEASLDEIFIRTTGRTLQ